VALKGDRDFFVVDADSFQLMRDEVGVGEIKRLTESDASLLAPHLGSHQDTLFIASSGVFIPEYDCYFKSEEQQVAVEWTRFESNPRPNERECNTYRYIFGKTPEGKCRGYQVTEPTSSPSTGQVADHHMDFDPLFQRYGLDKP